MPKEGGGVTVNVGYKVIGYEATSLIKQHFPVPTLQMQTEVSADHITPHEATISSRKEFPYIRYLL